MERAGTDLANFAFPSFVYHTQVDGQMVLLNLESEEYFGLDIVGTNIVTRLTQESYESAYASLLNDYEVDPLVLRHDVDELIEKLLERGLLVPGEQPA